MLLLLVAAAFFVVVSCPDKGATLTHATLKGFKPRWTQTPMLVCTAEGSLEEDDDDERERERESL